MTSISSLKRYTGIGSLPHHDVEEALDHSFQMGIPYLPQLPNRNPSEFMIAQALEGVPGIVIQSNGNVSLEIDEWNIKCSDFEIELDAALSIQLINQSVDQSINHANHASELTRFEPSDSSSSCWQPFLRRLTSRNALDQANNHSNSQSVNELDSQSNNHTVISSDERSDDRIAIAKIQLVGPFTVHCALVTQNGETMDRYPAISAQITKQILARSLAMTHRLQSLSVQPMIFLDEPCLSMLSISDSAHLVLLEHLKQTVQTLKSHHVIVGVHCCGNTEWNAVFDLRPCYVSFDTSISLESVLACQNGHALADYIRSGGRLALGIIPTSGTAFNPHRIVENVRHRIHHTFQNEPELLQRIFDESLLTPACGLALRPLSSVGPVMRDLVEACECFMQDLKVECSQNGVVDR